MRKITHAAAFVAGILFTATIITAATTALAGGGTPAPQADLTVSVPYTELAPWASFRVLEDAQHPFDDPSYFNVIEGNYIYLGSACPKTTTQVAFWIGGNASNWTPIVEGDRTVFAFASDNDTVLSPKFGRLQVDADHELVQRYNRSWIGQRATYRCTNQYDYRVPLMPAPPAQLIPRSLTIADVNAWCTNCDSSKFSYVQEGNRFVVHYEDNGCTAQFTIPPGINYQAASLSSGVISLSQPETIKNVCAITLRLIQ